MNTIRKTDLRLPRSWNECSTAQLELISRILLEQIARADRYHPFDMRNVKLACFFVLSGLEVVEGPSLSLPIGEQYYLCRLSSSGKGWRRWFGHRSGGGDTFPLYLWEINYWLSPKASTKDRQSVEYISSGAGILDWMDSNSASKLTRFPYPTLRLRLPGHWLCRRTQFQGPAPDMDGFSWQQYRFASDLMGQYTQLSNNLVRMQRMGSFTPVQMEQQTHSVNEARAMFLATIFNRRIPYLDPNTSLRTVDFHYDTRQFRDNAGYFRQFPDHRWQPVLFWWTGMMHTLSRRFPHVFKVQPTDSRQRPSTPLEIYTATIATMQKYASLTEDQVNNQSYSLVLEHLERLSKENEEMERIRKNK